MNFRAFARALENHAEGFGQRETLYYVVETWTTGRNLIRRQVLYPDVSACDRSAVRRNESNQQCINAADPASGIVYCGN